MDLNEALTQVAEIRRQMARAEVFRGYRSVPVAFSGLLAAAAGVYQAGRIGDPTDQLGPYLALWLGAAVIGAMGAGLEMTVRAWRAPLPWARRVTWLAVEQFLPSMAAGGLLTFVLVRTAPESAWMLPGLWQILFALGVFASFRLLPRATFGVGVFYLATGLACLAWAKGPWALSPWVMGLPFATGQFLAAGILYWTLERGDVEP